MLQNVRRKMKATTTTGSTSSTTSTRLRVNFQKKKLMPKEDANPNPGVPESGPIEVQSYIDWGRKVEISTRTCPLTSCKKQETTCCAQRPLIPSDKLRQLFPL